MNRKYYLKEYQKKWLRDRRIKWIQSQGNVCVICNSSQDLEIDHIDPELKSCNVSSLWSRKESVRELELKKCQVLCRKCHLDKTANYRFSKMSHGARGMYGRGCRCEDCKEWKSESNKKYRNK